MSISTKPVSGFRDFLPVAARRRQRVFDLIRQVYESYGFEPLETPCFENLSTLLGKYGEEGDQLIFRILHRGQKLEKALAGEGAGEATLAEHGLRYDLTVPLARVYAQYRNELPSYFKRYQLAPVWRADRPQRGRFREFYQCDVDIVGSSSMTVEAEVTSAISEILGRLGFDDVRIHLNSRKLLRALILCAGIDVSMESQTLVAIDKLDKIGLEGVQKELLERGITQEQADVLLSILGMDLARDNAEILAELEAKVGELEQGRLALDELKLLLELTAGSPAAARIRIDPFLARGLSYYTGPIFELRSDDFSGSLGGGGRYDGLIGMFSKQEVPACGFSLGVERLLVLMEERGMFEQDQPAAQVLVTIFDQERAAASIALAHELRALGLKVDLYPDAQDKLKKQLKYADETKVPVVAILAPDELASGQLTLKNMRQSEQVTLPRDQALQTLKAWLA